MTTSLCQDLNTSETEKHELNAELTATKTKLSKKLTKGKGCVVKARHKQTEM